MAESNIDVKIIVFLLTVTVSVILLLPLFAIIKREEWMIASLIVLFVLWLSIFLSKDRFSNSHSKTLLQRAKISFFQWLRFVLILVFISYLIAFTPKFFQALRNSLTSLDQNINIQTQKKRIADKADLPINSVNVTYFNDQFIFWEINGNTKENSFLVTSFNATFSIDSLPEIRLPKPLAIDSINGLNTF